MKITSDCVINCHSKSFATPTVICKTFLSSSSNVHIKEIKASDLPADSVRFKQGQQIADSVLQLSAIKFSNQLAAS